MTKTVKRSLILTLLLLLFGAISVFCIMQPRSAGASEAANEDYHEYWIIKEHPQNYISTTSDANGSFRYNGGGFEIAAISVTTGATAQIQYIYKTNAATKSAFFWDGEETYFTDIDNQPPLTPAESASPHWMGGSFSLMRR